MKACLTIFTDVPFSPAGGCLLLLFLTQHKREEGQPEPVDRENIHTHRADRCYRHPTLVRAQKSLVDDKSPVKLREENDSGFC